MQMIERILIGAMFVILTIGLLAFGACVLMAVTCFAHTHGDLYGSCR